MNKAILTGGVTREPKSFTCKDGRNGCVYSFAADNGKNVPSTYYSLFCYDKAAEFAAKYFKPGTALIVTANRISGGEPYQDKEGKWHSTLEGFVESQEFQRGGSSKEADAPQAYVPQERETSPVQTETRDTQPKAESHQAAAPAQSAPASTEDEELPWQ